MGETLCAGGARLTLRPECGGTVDALLLEPPFGDEAVALLAPQGSAEGAGGACDPGLFRGRLLAPFSDRIPAGRYRFEGESFELPVNDQETGDAIHGFLYSRAMQVRSIRDNELLLGYRTHGDCSGYPFELDITARYELTPGSFRLTLTATNGGSRRLPVTLGWHPYFTLPGVERVDELLLQLPAKRYVAVDRRLIPTGELPEVEDTPWDFSSLRPVGAGDLDLGFPLEGRQILLRAPEEKGRSLTMDLGGSFRYCQLFVPPNRGSIAVEPLTAATNAFNQPELGLTILEPGEEVSGSCRLSLS